MDNVRQVIEFLQNADWPYLIGATGKVKMNWPRVLEILIPLAFFAGFYYSDMSSLKEDVKEIKMIIEDAHPRQ